MVRQKDSPELPGQITRIRYRRGEGNVTTEAQTRVLGPTPQNSCSSQVLERQERDPPKGLREDGPLMPELQSSEHHFRHCLQRETEYTCSGFSFGLIFIAFVCVYAQDTPTCYSVHVEQRAMSGNWFSPSTTWVPETEHKAAGSMACTFTG